jgi:3-phenylpropionate/trans-cinnamate dioxygenase ferredoxin reductase component
MSGLRRIVVVGASLAGLRAAEALRSEGFDGRLTVLGAESHMPYDRPPLSKEVLTGSMSRADIDFRIPDDLDAEWILGDAATGLDLQRRVVSSAAGRELEFDGLVIATGSAPRRLPLLEPGSLDGIVELRTLEDSLALRATLERKPRVVLVGCGFIGIEVASSARALGCEVDMVSLDPPLIVAGNVFSDVCSEMLLDHGVRMHLGRHITEVHGAARVEAVVLDDGVRLSADVVVVAVGAHPVTDWLAGSGVPLDDGVVCDSSCAVQGAPGVVAAGDVARWTNPLFGEAPMRIEHWTNAAEQAGAAARTLLHGSGRHTAFSSVPSFWSDHFGTRLQSVGLPLLADRLEVVDGSVQERRFVAVGYRGDEVVGATTYGMIRGLLRYRMQLAKREPVAS